MTRPLTAATLAALLALPAIALAQPRPDPTQRPEPAPLTTPSNPSAAPPEKIAPPADARESSGSSGEPLGDRLSRSQGVIKPPSGVDPGMATPAPDPGPRSMPVIPPPGTGRGDPITPK